MPEFLLGIVAGATLALLVVRRYLNREGKVAETIRRVVGVIKEQ